ncbi:sensor domain-containing diguanylate cyclase [Paenibacillus ginsengarvi]|uniref:Diguanylate cyclase n=1 Tax=Paenibacillus ginsengarvi TaxID=400777 RepID=A0A3B0BHP3_9BACL|nr:GGDEF domain-containing protein [Paenibacillus ginsengarvi]RKN71881.1 diguanylate cyclase [Paenibacillus ginsengarvi]
MRGGVLFGKFRVYSLKGRLRLLVALMILSMCLLVLAFMSFFGKVIKEREIHATLQEAIDLQKLYVDKWKSQRLSDIGYLAETQAARSLNMQEMGSQFRLFKKSHSDFDSFAFADKDGKFLLQMDETPAETSIGDRSYFLAARSLQANVSDVISGRLSGKPMLVFIAPVLNKDGAFAGAVLGSVKVSMLDSIVNEFKFGDNGETFLLNKSGYRLTKLKGEAEDEWTREQYTTDIYERALAGVQSREAYLNRSGERVFGAYAWTADGEWLIIGETRVRDVYKPYYRLLVALALSCALILLLTYFAATLFTRKISRVLAHLLYGTKRIRSGEFGYRIDPAVIRNAPSELKELSDNFNIMSDKLQTTVQLLEESAVVDHLTDVYNRRFLMNEGAKIEEASARAGNSSSILLIDVDYFKKINDTYGHLIGDRVLKHAASLLVDCVRRSDVVARYGGEEFVVLATNCPIHCGRELAERIRASFVRTPYRDEEREIAITISIGVSQSKPERKYGTNTLEDMIERADKALYRAKNGGRNRVECDDCGSAAPSGSRSDSDSG